MATPAQVANDMAAQASFWEKRDKVIHRACHDSARLIRAFLAGERVDGRTYHGLFGRLLDLESGRARAHFGIADNLSRARQTLSELHRKATAK